MKEFNKYYNENVIKIGFDKYIEQTTQYQKEFTLEELIKFFKKEYNLQ